MDRATLDWLLERQNPSVRYFTLKHLLHRSERDHELVKAKHAVMGSPAVQVILRAQHQEGYWDRPGQGYVRKYVGTDWSILFLAEFGATARNLQVRRGCQYLMAHARAADGSFSAMAGNAPSGSVTCLNGNLIRALLSLEYDDRAGIEAAVDWLARAITGEGVERFYSGGTSGPGFRCGANGGLPCAWGAVKSLRALSALPQKIKTPLTERALRQTVELLLSTDLARSDYPADTRVSDEWFRFGFPLGYTSNVLEALLALGEAGCRGDKRLRPAIDLVLSERDAAGRWKMQHSLNGKLWADVEARGEESKWVTLNALRALDLQGVEA